MKTEEGGKALRALLLSAQENEKGDDVEDSRDDEPGCTTPEVKGQLSFVIHGRTNEFKGKFF